MKTSLITRAKKLHWIFFWSGNFPIFICHLWNDANYEVAFRKIAGTYPKALLVLSTKGWVKEYHAQEEYDRLEKYFVAKFEKDPRFLVRSACAYRPQVNRDLAALKRINKINFSKLSNKQLAALMTKAHKYFSYNAAIDHYDWYMEKFLIPELQTYLIKRLGELDKTHLIPEYVNTLITPHQVSVVYKERQQFFDIIKHIRKNQAIASAVKRNALPSGVLKSCPGLAKKFDQYLANWNWISIHMNNPPNTLNDVWKEVREWVVSKAPLKVKAKRLGDDYDQTVIRKSFTYMQELKPPRKMRLLIEGLRAMTFLRTEDFVVMSQSAYLITPVYKEIAKRLQVTVQELKDFTPPEVVAYLNSSKQIPRSEVTSRRKLVVFLSLNGQRRVYTGAVARNLQRYLSQPAQPKSKQGTATLTGLPASVGKFRGPARVALDPQSANKVKNSEVLVGATMSLMFTQALRNAGAIIAEYGGLASHPVIISREMNTPCVVGVSGATGQIKTGDIVEVDADQGIIKVIKRAK